MVETVAHAIIAKTSVLRYKQEFCFVAFRVERLRVKKYE